MQYALPLVLPDVPAGGVCAGIDWATADHVACVVDSAGRVTDRFSAAHDKAGITALITWLRRSKVTEVAIERGDGPLVDALLGAGLTVVVITSRQVRNLRSRFGAAGAKDDRFDAFVLADTLRTDRARLRPLVPDTPATVSLRMTVGHAGTWCGTGWRPATSCAPTWPSRSRPRSRCSTTWTARSAWPSWPVSAARTPPPGWVSRRSARGWRPSRCAGARPRPACCTPGCTPRRPAPPGPTAPPRQASPPPLTATLTALSAQIKALATQIAGQLAAHPDGHIVTSLPRPGTVRAARLLAEIGDCRSRFPDPESLAGLAGVAPVTRRSGTRIAHGFRWAVNRQLRDALCDFAADSRHASPWAAAIYDAARARGKDHPLAVRITARAWTYVIWRCWHDGTGYDPAKHHALQAVLARQQAAQAAGPARQQDQ